MYCEKNDKNNVVKYILLKVMTEYIIIFNLFIDYDVLLCNTTK